MNYKKVFLKRSAFTSIASGHPWCFAGSVEHTERDLKGGDLCSMYIDKRFFGVGYYSTSPDIRVRVLSRKDTEINRAFFRQRFEELNTLKRAFLTDTDAFRLVHGESDGIPGLVVDIYGDICVMQIHTLGIDNLKHEITAALTDALDPKMIYEKSDTEIRKKDGLNRDAKGLLYGRETAEVIITENGFKFDVNVVEGHKTGFFLDQRENRRAVMQYTAGKKVLNLFCYTGGFSVYAASNAKSVTSIDISKPAIDGCRKNFELNGYPLEKHRFEACDAFDFLKEIHMHSYDVIVLDPPQLAQNKKQLDTAVKAYTTLNSKALEKLPDGGILITSSCTTHIDDAAFVKILHMSSLNAKCRIRIIESKLQPQDHTYNPAFPEGRYLKFFVVQKTAVF